MEIMKLDLEQQKLNIVKEGKLVEMISQEQNVLLNSCNFDINSALRPIPVFDERDLDTFFYFV